MKSGNINFKETSGPLQACNGTALLLPFLLSVCGEQNLEYGQDVSIPHPL